MAPQTFDKELLQSMVKRFVAESSEQRPIKIMDFTNRRIVDGFYRIDGARMVRIFTQDRRINTTIDLLKVCQLSSAEEISDPTILIEARKMERLAGMSPACYIMFKETAQEEIEAAKKSGLGYAPNSQGTYLQSYRMDAPGATNTVMQGKFVRQSVSLPDDADRVRMSGLAFTPETMATAGVNPGHARNVFLTCMKVLKVHCDMKYANRR